MGATGAAAQPRNLIGKAPGLGTGRRRRYRYLPDVLVLQEAAAVATAIALMMATRTIHPPGATALIAVIGGEGMRWMGICFRS